MSAPSVRAAQNARPAAASGASASSSATAADDSAAGVWSWKAFAAAAAIVGTASAVIGFLKYRQRRRLFLPEGTDDHPPALEALPRATKPTAVSASQKRAAAASIQVTPRTWTEMEFGQATTQFLEQLGNAGQADTRLEAEIRAALVQVVAFTNEARALGAHFLLATNAHYLTESTSEKEFDELMKQQAIDMKVAWRLLDCPESSATPDQCRALNVMRIQVAQCLKDAGLMLPIFERMTARAIEDFNDEELILLFTTAPLLGRWAQTVQLGDRLATMHDLSDFHGAPMDYQILYELAKVEQAKGNVPMGQLQWKNFKIVMQRIKLRQSECEDQTVLQSLEREFTHEGARTWKILPVHDALRLVRCGALSQLRSFSPVPLALVGPSSDTRIHTQGYAYLGGGDQQTQGPPPVKQIETYELQRVQRAEFEGEEGGPADDGVSSVGPHLHWKGAYTMVQEPVDLPGQTNPHAMPTLRVVFDFEMTIEAIASA